MPLSRVQACFKQNACAHTQWFMLGSDDMRDVERRKHERKMIPRKREGRVIREITHNWYFTHLSLIALWTEALVTFYNPSNHSGVSQRDRYPPTPTQPEERLQRRDLPCFPHSLEDSALQFGSNWKLSSKAKILTIGELGQRWSCFSRMRQYTGHGAILRDFSRGVVGHAWSSTG